MTTDTELFTILTNPKNTLYRVRARFFKASVELEACEAAEIAGCYLEDMPFVRAEYHDAKAALETAERAEIERRKGVQ